MVRKVVEKIADEQLQKDLEKYRQMALELGATDAKIITTDMIVIDERQRAKCLFPVSPMYGSDIYSPPHGVDVDFMRKVVNKYRYAIFTKQEIPAEKIAGPEAEKKLLSIPYQRENCELVAKIELEAFHDGYYLAMGFANASCKLVFCSDKECIALQPKQFPSCVAPLQARPSMEGVGIDAIAMAAKVDWDVYPIRRSTPPSEVPHGVALGLVLIY